MVGVKGLRIGSKEGGECLDQLREHQLIDNCETSIATLSRLKAIGVKFLCNFKTRKK
jgi:hypothetical protein